MRLRGDGRSGERLLPSRSPASDRLQVLQGIRAGAVVLVLVCARVAPASLAPGLHRLVALTLGFAGVAVLGWLVVRFRPHSVPLLPRAMLVVDAGWLVVGAHVSGGAGSPLAYAVLLHLAAVTIVASHRTGLVLAVLDTVLLVSLRAAVDTGLLAETAPPAGASPHEQLGVLLVVLWIVSLTTTALSVLNRRELRRRRHDLDALTLLTERVERAARPAAVAQTLLEAVVSTYGLKRGAVLVTRDGKDVVLASHGTAEAPLAGRSTSVEAAHAKQGAVLVRPVSAEDDPWLSALLPAAAGVVVVPMGADSRPLGALVVEAGGRPSQARRMLGGLERSAAYGALALRNASLMEAVQRLAATDGLTKIANRRAFETTLERELARATRTNEHVSLVMVDIDHFKRLNDSLGHQAGDEVLRNAAAALACACREFDTAARYGGEEFAVILPGCDPDQAREAAERLRLAVCAGPTPVPLTASAGVATFPAHAGDAESLVRAADEALYASKRAGRDQTSVSLGIPPEEQVNALIRRAVRERLRARQVQEARGGDEAPRLPQYDT
jgi:diguanylate cyclase (GGDEF)-like protein